MKEYLIWDELTTEAKNRVVHEALSEVIPDTPHWNDVCETDAVRYTERDELAPFLLNVLAVHDYRPQLVYGNMTKKWHIELKGPIKFFHAKTIAKVASLAFVLTFLDYIVD